MRSGSSVGLTFEIWIPSVCSPDGGGTGHALSGEGGACCPRRASVVSGRRTNKPARQRSLTPVFSLEGSRKLRARAENVVYRFRLPASIPLPLPLVRVGPGPSFHDQKLR